jgi:acyl-CoA synthetase (AMP-forming)/AMP-acid ligase II
MRDGELYVTGRLKDVIVVRGRNLYPQDLESAAQTVDEFHCGTSAVFALSDPAGDGSEDIVVVQEIKPGALRTGAVQEIATRISATLVREFGVKPPSVVLVRPGAVRKTTSGKVRRSLMRELFLRMELDASHEELTDQAQALRSPGVAGTPR